MFGNQWHKKEKPVATLMGLGGGATALINNAGSSWYSGPGGISATGGDITVDYSTNPTTHYRCHVFYSSGTFTVVRLAQDSPNYPNQIEYLNVGGGGGGGTRFGGGGGAGGFEAQPLNPAAVQDYPVVVGAGGAGGVTSGAPGTSGAGFGSVGSDTSSFGATMHGGGGGGAGDSGNGLASPGKGSGGGGAGRFSSTGGGSGSNGNPGGNCPGGPQGGDNFRGAGGGGYGGVGAAGSGSSDGFS